MRHGKKQNSLGRKSAHRKAMLSNMACSLIEHKRINTTVAKAKALRVFLEPIITKSKTDSTHSRRVVFSYLQNKEAVAELFREVSPKVADRPGGYLRIIRLGNRQGDNAEMCMIELVDFNEVMVKEDKTKKTRRSRRGGGSSTKAAVEASSTEKEEAPKAEGEVKAEAPKKEAKKATSKAETKAAPKKAAPKAEAKKAAPKKEEAKAETKKAAPKAEKKEADKEDKKADDKKEDK